MFFPHESSLCWYQQFPNLYFCSFCFSYYSWCFQDYFLINWVFEGFKKSHTFWRVSTVVEAEAGQGFGSSMPCHLTIIQEPFRKQVGSLFTSGLLHSFTQVKVKEVFLTEWTLHLKKCILLTQKCYCEFGIQIAITYNLPT